MPRSPNAQLGVNLYKQLQQEFGWDQQTAWHGIALLLLSCDKWVAGWLPFKNVVIYREVNDFKQGQKGPNAVLRRAETLSTYLASELSVNRADLCAHIGKYWKDPQIAPFQPHNLAGHAFRSLIVHILGSFGDPGLTYEEERSPYKEFPGHTFSTRSKDPKIDIVARRGAVTVALLSCRWRFRHDRVDVVEEAMAYAPAAHRHNPRCKLYAVLGEFSPDRLNKVISNCALVEPHSALAAAVHFAPQLILNGLGINGRMAQLRSLEWLIQETYTWV